MTNTMKTICGLNCCDQCSLKASCKGCIETDGHPFGGKCAAATFIKNGECFECIKKRLVEEVNSLGIKGLHINQLYMLNGNYVNLEYTLSNGSKIKFLDDKNIYFGNQVEIPGSEKCYGVIVDNDFILICMYGANGSDPELILFKKR